MKSDTETNSQNKHAISFPIDIRESESSANSPDCRLKNMIKEQIQNILNLVVLTDNGKDVCVNGFKLMNGTDTIYDIFK